MILKLQDDAGSKQFSLGLLMSPIECYMIVMVRFSLAALEIVSATINFCLYSRDKTSQYEMCVLVF